MISFTVRTKHARMFVGQLQYIKVPVPGRQPLNIKIVAKYKQLGGLICGNHDLTEEVFVRAATARSAEVAISRNIFGNPSIDIKLRYLYHKSFVLFK